MLKSVNQELKKWVLIAEDEEGFREKVVAFIELYFGTSVKVVQCKDGAEATSRLPYQSFDCILTDLRMPNKEGPALIKSIRHSGLNDKTPIIVISAFDATDVTSAFKHVHVLEKPCGNKEIVELLESQLKLGKTDNRIAADLLNSVVDSTMLFAGRASGGEEVQHNSALAKKSGEGLRGEVWRSFSVQVGRVRNEFVLGFEKEFLAQLKGDTAEQKAAIAADIIVKHSVKDMDKDLVTVDSRMTIESGSEDYKRLSRKKGITLPIQVGDAHVFVKALWEDR